MDDPASFYAELDRRLDRSPAVAVAQIVRHRGSTPRKTGARMLIDPSGASLGTVGGGCGEAEVMSRAQRVLGTGEPMLVEVSLLEEDGWESPSICGGVVDVFVERVDGAIGGIPRDEFRAALDAARDAGRALAVVTVIAANRAHETPDAPVPGDVELGRKTLVDERGVQQFPLGDARLDEAIVDSALEVLTDDRARVVRLETEGRIEVFVERLSDPPELVVVGAGHVGTALTRIAAQAGFVVTVLDDRVSFANPVRLPEARSIRTGDPRRDLASLTPRRDRHVVLVTRGHRLDADCLRVALEMDLAYLGMIGSRRRVGRILEMLASEGVAAEKLRAVHAPIGLDIGAETPGEIAVAILAEIIDRRRGGRAGERSLARGSRGAARLADR
jgi:xanthine dehydrogenase accessory factor